MPTAEPSGLPDPKGPRNPAQLCSQAPHVALESLPRQAAQVSKIKPSREVASGLLPRLMLPPEMFTESQPLFPEPTNLNPFPIGGTCFLPLPALKEKPACTPGGTAISLLRL